MKINLFTRNSPPGINIKQEAGIFIAGLVCATIYSFSFFISYIVAREMLAEGEKLAMFGTLLGSSLNGFIMLAICMPGFIVIHYLYFRQGSKSIYLMKRLPVRTELYRRIFMLPVLAVFTSLAAAFAIKMIYFAVYMVFTPSEYLLPGQWQELWRI